MTTRDMWMIAIGAAFGFIASWSLNRQLLRAAYAIERARHHYEAAVSWMYSLGRTVRATLLLATAIAALVVGGVWLLIESTMNGVPFSG